MTYGEAEAWATLADANRRWILTELAEGERTVGELTDPLPISRPAVSQHLKVLKDAGLVTERTYRHPADLPAEPRPGSPRCATSSTPSGTGPGQLYRVPSTDEGGRMTEADRGTVVRTQIVVDGTAGARVRSLHRAVRRLQAPRAQPARRPRSLETVFEPQVGGHIVDRGEDGSECRWARVLAFDPPDRLVFSWDIGPTWQLETDPENASEVEVRFVAEGPDRTRVELEHRHLDRHGPGWPRRPATAWTATRAGRCTWPGTPPCSGGGMTIVAVEVDRPAAEVFAYATDPTQFPMAAGRGRAGRGEQRAPRSATTA